MNIDDVADQTTIPEKVFAAIFDRQKELMSKYDHIEAKNGLTLPEAPYQLDDKFLQYRLKDFFWRTTEELAEALEVTVEPKNWRERWADDADLRHMYEEVADALHFFVEASIYANIKPEAVESISPTMPTEPLDSIAIRDECANLVFAMGLAANCLKNKPWKQTQMATDHNRFLEQMRLAWTHFHLLWCWMGCTRADVYNLYMKKNTVNGFRIRSNY